MFNRKSVTGDPFISISDSINHYGIVGLSAEPIEIRNRDILYFGVSYNDI